ncbi:MAG: ABC transporter ATP-binding protein [Proteobacteria bacterium]|nr:ABC transporter ATP-binding protein [Pseudomonadota bacterium]MBI3497153.1 ABC transporter ATP-binding protein [Pseudomonadota bacterium]
MRIETRRLGVSYGGIRALDGVSITAEPGRFTCVIGPNGSGKSTLVKAIAGIVRSTGELLFDGCAERPLRLGYMPQEIGARAALTVLETALLGRLGRLGLRVGDEDLAAVRAVLRELDIESFAPRYLGELSGGQRQLVFLAQALTSDPSVLLLDEPISALDIRHQLEVLDTVRRLTRERALTTIAVLHDLNATARFADEVILLRDGRMLGQASPVSLFTPAAVAQAFDVEALVGLDAAGYPSVTPLRPLRREAAS